MFRQITGAAGAALASLCCLGFAPLLAALSAAGLGFVVADAVLIPAMALFLALTLWGLHGSRRRHRDRRPLLVGLAGAIAALAGVFVFVPIHVAGLVMVVLAVVWDLALSIRSR